MRFRHDTVVAVRRHVGETGDGFPLSSAQRGIWFAQHLLGDIPLTIAQYVDVRGEFDPEIFADAGAATARFFGNPLNMWGPFDDPTWVANDPYVNAEKLRGTTLYLSSRTGLPGRYDNLESEWIKDEEDLTDVVIKGGLIEAAAADCTRRMATRLDERGIPATIDIHDDGTHNWGYWQDDLHNSWPVLGPAIGAS